MPRWGRGIIIISDETIIASPLPASQRPLKRIEFARILLKLNSSVKHVL